MKNELEKYKALLLKVYNLLKKEYPEDAETIKNEFGGETAGEPYATLDEIEKALNL